MNFKKLIPALLFIAVGIIYFRSESNGEFIGQPGPEFQVEEWISQQPNRNDKFVLIDFWATWCGPCLRMIPHMNELHAEFRDQLVVVGVSNEARSKVEALKNPVMEYYSAIDRQNRMGNFFDIRSIPQVVLMDPEGVVVWKGHPANLTHSKLESLLNQG